MCKVKKAICVAASVLCVATCTVGVTAMPAQAKTVKASVNYKKAKSVKRGKTTISTTYKGDKHLYLKFKAPKTKKYTFTISNMKSNHLTDGKDINHGNFAIATQKYGHPWELYAKTKGGKTLFMEICSQDAYAINAPTSIDIYTALPSRSGTVKLKKGQVVWIEYFTTARGKSTCTLTIK